MTSVTSSILTLWAYLPIFDFVGLWIKYKIASIVHKMKNTPTADYSGVSLFFTDFANAMTSILLVNDFSFVCNDMG